MAEVTEVQMWRDLYEAERRRVAELEAALRGFRDELQAEVDVGGQVAIHPSEIDDVLKGKDAMAEESGRPSGPMADLTRLAHLALLGATTPSVRNPDAATPVMGVRPIIHRDGTFELHGDTFVAMNHGPNWGYEICTWPDLRHVADGYHTLADLREDAERAVTAWREARA